MLGHEDVEKWNATDKIELAVAVSFRIFLQ